MPLSNSMGNRSTFTVSLSRQKSRNRIQSGRPDKLPPHSITSSAWTSNVGGISRLSTFAVLRLMTNSISVGNSTGKSVSLVPLIFCRRSRPRDGSTSSNRRRNSLGLPLRRARGTHNFVCWPDIARCTRLGNHDPYLQFVALSHDLAALLVSLRISRIVQ